MKRIGYKTKPKRGNGKVRKNLKRKCKPKDDHDLEDCGTLGVKDRVPKKHKIGAVKKNLKTKRQLRYDHNLGTKKPQKRRCGDVKKNLKKKCDDYCSENSDHSEVSENWTDVNTSEEDGTEPNKHRCGDVKKNLKKKCDDHCSENTDHSEVSENWTDVNTSEEDGTEPNKSRYGDVKKNSRTKFDNHDSEDLDNSDDSEVSQVSEDWNDSSTLGEEGPEPKRRRTMHNDKEKKRRGELKDLYQTIQDILPGLREGVTYSRRTLLKKSHEWIKCQKLRVSREISKLAVLDKDIEKISSDNMNLKTLVDIKKILEEKSKKREEGSSELEDYHFNFDCDPLLSEELGALELEELDE